jgi:hypothetical protein
VDPKVSLNTITTRAQLNPDFEYWGFLADADVISRRVGIAGEVLQDSPNRSKRQVHFVGGSVGVPSP